MWWKQHNRSFNVTSPTYNVCRIVQIASHDGRWPKKEIVHSSEALFLLKTGLEIALSNICSQGVNLCNFLWERYLPLYRVCRIVLLICQQLCVWLMITFHSFNAGVQHANLLSAALSALQLWAEAWVSVTDHGTESLPCYSVSIEGLTHQEQTAHTHSI